MLTVLRLAAAIAATNAMVAGGARDDRRASDATDARADDDAPPEHRGRRNRRRRPRYRACDHALSDRRRSHSAGRLVEFGKLDPNFYPIGVGVTAQDTVWIAFSVNRGPSRKSLFAAISPAGHVRNVPVRSATFVRGRYAAYGMAPTPDGRYLWYSGMDDRITRLALATMTTISFPRDKRQNQLTVDAHGAGWFPNGDGILNSVAEGSGVARTYPNVIPREAGSVLSMSASQDGTIWFVTALDHHIRWFDPQSNARGDCAPDKGARGPGRVQGAARQRRVRRRSGAG